MVRNTITNHSQSYPLAKKCFDRVLKISLVLIKERQKKKKTKQTLPSLAKGSVSYPLYPVDCSTLHAARHFLVRTPPSVRARSSEWVNVCVIMNVFDICCVVSFYL